MSKYNTHYANRNFLSALMNWILMLLILLAALGILTLNVPKKTIDHTSLRCSDKPITQG